MRYGDTISIYVTRFNIFQVAVYGTGDSGAALEACVTHSLTTNLLCAYSAAIMFRYDLLLRLWQLNFQVFIPIDNLCGLFRR